MAFNSLIDLAIGAASGGTLAQLFRWLSGRTTYQKTVIITLQEEITRLSKELKEVKDDLDSIRLEKHWNVEELGGAILTMEVALARGCDCGISVYLEAFKKRLAEHRAELAKAALSGSRPV